MCFDKYTHNNPTLIVCGALKTIQPTSIHWEFKLQNVIGCHNTLALFMNYDSVKCCVFF